MITYKQYFGDSIYNEIVHKPEVLKEIYKLYFNVDKTSLGYSQKLKSLLLTNISNTGLFIAFKDKKPVALAKGSYEKGHFTLNHVSVSKGESKFLEAKIIMRAVSYSRVKKGAVKFDVSHIVSNSSKETFKKIFSRDNFSKKIGYGPEKLFSKKTFSTFKKAPVIRKK